MTIEKYRKFVKKLVDKESLDDDLDYEARDLLEEDFKDQVIDIWKVYFNYGSFKEAKRKEIKTISKNEFIKYWCSTIDEEKFLEEHWNELDKVISILQDYIKELEAEEAKETKEND